MAVFTFFRQTLGDFRTTGAVAPSSPFLARAMVRGLPQGQAVGDDFRVLEAGPGTGSFTEAIIARLGGRGQLDLYEVSAPFAEHLRRRIESDPLFAPMRGRIRLECADVRAAPARPPYDAVISGLPFNNFTGAEVAEVLGHFRRVLKPGGTLSFFEYLAIRRLQAPFVGAQRRRRLREVARVVHEFARLHQFAQDIALVNIPPARVRHMRLAD